MFMMNDSMVFVERHQFGHDMNKDGEMDKGSSF